MPMLDKETAKAGADALCSAIAALGEVVVEVGAAALTEEHDYDAQAHAVTSLAADIETLARALAVIARRAAAGASP